MDRSERRFQGEKKNRPSLGKEKTLELIYRKREEESA